jgi:hypothetical protein
VLRPSYWAEINRHLWNHYQTEGPRTTNHLEGWHSKLKKHLQHPHHNIFNLIKLHVVVLFVGYLKTSVLHFSPYELRIVEEATFCVDAWKNGVCCVSYGYLIVKEDSSGW